jgi:hypothetical protein
LLKEAVLVGGLDTWRYENPEAMVIKEPRLRDVVARLLLKQGHPVPLSQEQAFRRPPLCDDNQPKRAQGIDALEFPSWFSCQGCRRLVPSRDFASNRPGEYWHDCDDRARCRCVPVRFVLACKRGHIEEFRWVAFVHELQGVPRCPAPALKLLEGKTGDLSEVVVQCACGARRALVSAYAAGANGTCTGQRPWLGSDADAGASAGAGAYLGCDVPLHLLMRAASNGYFAQVVSALSIPDPSRRLHDAVSTNWSKLHAVEAIGELGLVRRQTGTALVDFTDAELWDGIQVLKKGGAPQTEPLRTAEYKQLVRAPPERFADQPEPGETYFARALGRQHPLPEQIARVVLVHRLREVRVQVGFTRLEAPSPDLEGEYDLNVESAALGLRTDWLPAMEVRGEGIFIELEEHAVRTWESRPAVKRRGEELEAGYAAWVKQRFQHLKGEDQITPPPFPGVRFYLLHSLSHLLMSALSLECGYAASSLAERIYCSLPGAAPSLPMAGILISTGTAGAEGTLGGLVEQGRELDRHLRRALALGQLCSHDPVCASHSPADDRAERHLEGAACHGCLFVAECSCERFNQYLDRALVVPALGHDGLAFFPLPATGGE